MESGWEEKKIQALFSELRTADEQVASHFATTWNRAQPTPRRKRAFNPAFVAATALLIFALVSFAVWSKYSQRTPQPNVAVAVPPASINPLPTKADENSGSVVMPKVNLREPVAKSRAAKLAVRRHAQLLAANHKLASEAKAITSWQSPTSALLSSPSDQVFSSLPQLNQNASDLRSFLPNRSN